MNINFFCPHSDPLAKLGEPDSGGQCLYEAKVAKAIAAQNHSVKCFTRRYGSKPETESISNQALVHRVTMGDNAFLRKEDMGPHLPEFVHSTLRHHGDALDAADLYHGHYWDGGYAALAASLSTGKPCVFTSHSLGILKRDQIDTADLNYPIRVPAEHRVMNAVDRIIALSTIEQSALTDRYNIDPEKINIVPGGVDVDAFAPQADKATLKKKHGIDTDFMVLVVGRLDDRKGFLPYIDCLPLIVSQLAAVNKSVTFMIPKGGDNLNEAERQLRDSLSQRAEQLGVIEHVRFFGRPDDETLRDYYGAADTFACPSLYEPFGLVLVEAMAAGTAVASTNRGGPNDIVAVGEDGYLADPENPQQFADAILKILLAPEAEQTALHQAALRKAQTKYAWDAVAGQILAVYEDVLSNQRSSHRL